MKRRSLSIAIAITGVVALSSCGAKAPEQKAPPPTPVSIYEVKKEPAVYYDNYPATIAPLNQVDLKAQVTGYITGIYFKDGQHVTKGQKLYDIDRQQYQASYDQGVANLNVSKAALDKAQQDADRYNDLLKKDAVARQIYDHAVADLQSAKMQVAAAQANVAKLKTDLTYSVLYAPFDGTIGISLVKPGALVTANSTLLNTVSSNNPMAVDIPVDQKDIPAIVQLEANPPKETDSVFTLSFNNNTIIYPQVGAISLIDRAVDPQTGTIKTRLVFANPKDELKAGMNANVRIKHNRSTDLFILAPYKAVVEQMGEYFMYVVGDSSKVSQHKVVLGPRIADKVVVKTGLNEGDKIVTEGVQKVRDGAKVQVGQPQQPAPKK
ncbi:efflux RND transporter periplasmic adaptor subunit [Chitinophagaceae bacterium LWZ2-11]